MTTDNPGHPAGEQPENQAAEQTLSVSSAQAAQQLGINARTVRRYIADSKLPARQIRTPTGPEWQIYQADIDAFIEARDRAATEGQTATTIKAVEQQESQALQLIATELERRGQALEQAQATIERLAREAGRSEELQRQLEIERQRVRELEAELQKAQGQKPRRIRLLPWPQG